MSICKELLLSCIVVMHISFMASRPIEPIEEIKLRENMKELTLFLCNLKTAERDYVTYIFNGRPPKQYQSKPLEGITWPVGNTTEEIQTSICAITDYLDNHIPTIIGDLTEKHQRDLITNITVFSTQFKAAANMTSGGQNDAGVPKDCYRNVTTLHDYAKKLLGLRIIYFARQWVEHFSNTSCELTEDERVQL